MPATTSSRLDEKLKPTSSPTTIITASDTAFVESKHGGLLGDIATKGTDKKAWNDLTARMKTVLGEFGKEFAPDAAAA